MARHPKRAAEERFVLFADATECAKAAAPVFAAQRWRWTGRGVPSESDIFEVLVMLEREHERFPSQMTQSGRLIYLSGGKFGYERPREGRQ